MAQNRPSAVGETLLDNRVAPALALRATRIFKQFGHRIALHGVDLSVWEGERVALLGPNGAGKTTLLRILALLTRPTSGTVEVAGLDGAQDAQRIRALLGVSLHDSLLYPDLTVGENLRFFARLYQVRDVDERTAAILERLDLVRLANVRVRNLSRGQRQRSSLARALVHDPAVLLLDEPDTGQDLASLERMRIELLSQGSRAVLFATHQPSQVLSLATRVLVLAGGVAHELGAVTRLDADELQRCLLSVRG